MFSQSSLILHEYESVHIKFAHLQEDEFVLLPFLDLYLVNSTIASGADEFNMKSSQNFRPSICNPFPIGDSRFNAGTHPDFQMFDSSLCADEKLKHSKLVAMDLQTHSFM